MQQMPHNYAEDRIRRHTLTKRAHLAEQTGAPRIMHTRYQGPYVSLPSKDKDERWPGGAGRGRTWPASRPSAFQGVAPKSPDHLPYVHLAGTDPH